MKEISKRKITLGGVEVALYLLSCPKLEPKKMYSTQHRLGRELLAHALRERGLDFKESMLKTNTHGKPYLADFVDLHFNLSHSAQKIVLALAPTRIGVDIEERYTFSSAMVKRVFSERERELAETFSDKDAYYTRLWTLKESFFKCKGSGLILPLSTFSVSLPEGRLPVEFSTPEALFYQDAVGESIFSVCRLRGA